MSRWPADRGAKNPPGTVGRLVFLAARLRYSIDRQSNLFLAHLSCTSAGRIAFLPVKKPTSEFLLYFLNNKKTNNLHCSLAKFRIPAFPFHGGDLARRSGRCTKTRNATEWNRCAEINNPAENIRYIASEIKTAASKPVRRNALSSRRMRMSAAPRVARAFCGQSWESAVDAGSPQLL